MDAAELPSRVAALLGIVMLAASGALRAQTPKAVLPPAGFVPDAARGAALYAKHCVACHGRDARGTDRGPPLLHPGYRPEHHSDLAFFSAIQQGVGQHHWRFGDMPAVPALGPADAGHVVGWLRGEQRRTGIIH